MDQASNKPECVLSRFVYADIVPIVIRYAAPLCKLTLQINRWGFQDNYIAEITEVDNEVKLDMPWSIPYDVWNAIPDEPSSAATYLPWTIMMDENNVWKGHAAVGKGRWPPKQLFLRANDFSSKEEFAVLGIEFANIHCLVTSVALLCCV